MRWPLVVCPAAPPILFSGRLGVFCWTCQPWRWPRSALWPYAFRVLNNTPMDCCIARLGVFGWAAQPRVWPRFARWPSALLCVYLPSARLTKPSLG